MSDHMEFRAIDVPDHERFTMIYDDVWNVLKGTSQLSVYMALKRRTNPGNHSWFGTRKELAEESGVSSNTFTRGVQKLEELGLIKVKPRFVPAKWDKNPNTIVHERDADHPVQIGNLYLIRFHLPPNSGSTPPPKTGATPLPNSGATPLPKIGQQTYKPLDIDTGDIDTRKDMLISHEKSDDVSLPLDGIDAPGNDTPSSQKKTGAGKYPEDFLEWYAIYPRKKAKGDALKAYKAARKEVDHEVLMEKTRKFVVFVEQSQQEQQYIPYPATWLRASRWEDEEETPPAPPGYHTDVRKTSARDKSAEQLMREQWAREDAQLNNNNQPQTEVFEWPYGVSKEIEQ